MSSPARISPGRIPRIVHQIWKSRDLPDYASDSWQQAGGGWTWRLWTDDDLLGLVRDHYPQLEALYLSYPHNVQRADLGRYLVLDHCGGLYTDLDSECLGPLGPLWNDDRVILCEEPAEHFHHALPYGLDRLYFNGTMAGPARHPFWSHLIDTVHRCAHARAHVLESTGPMALTGAVISYPDPAGLALHSSHLFTPLTSDGIETAGPEHGPLAPLRLSNHLWRGSWVPQGRAPSVSREVRGLWRGIRYAMTRGPHLTGASLAPHIDRPRLQRPLGTGDRVAVLIPVRDAEPWLDRCMELLSALDYPSDKLSLTFCEGDSRDGTVDRLAKIRVAHSARFREIKVISSPGGPTFDRDRRWLPHLQFRRRANLARVRNHPIDHGIAPDDDWALWLDVDVCDYSPDILHRLLSERRKVVTPDCRLSWDGPSYDLNAFTDPTERRDVRYLKHVRRGLFMPPANYDRRRHLHDLRFLDRVPLTSVGGTMLLVAAEVHRAGIRFPELPYDDLLETEGFGRLCHHCGVTPIGLPNVPILHVKS
ncbi:MAG TPA: glycosyltransferase [Tabrizicola sp.]